MNIVVTDGYTLNAGDLSWESIAGLGALTVYDRTPAALIEERCKEADIVVSNKVPFSSDILSQLPQLKCIAVSATGFNIIDTSAAKKEALLYAMSRLIAQPLFPSMCLHYYSNLQIMFV
ncbi:MAG: hypothetical protein WKG06_08570 [Segetibacter sp.]